MTTPFDIKHVSLLWGTPERAGDIAAMHARLFDPTWSEESIVKLLDNPASTSFIAQLAVPRVPIGFLIGQIVGDEAEILSIGVAPELQKRGIGRHLVGGLVRAAQRAEAKRVFLEVAADNVAGLALYEALGFKANGRRAGYYERKGGQAVDALVLQLDLQNAA